jgi:hypothetical protein
MKYASICVLLIALTGCSSTAQRSAIIGGSSAAGAAGGYLLERNGSTKAKVLGAAGGALVGGALSTLALGDDKNVYQRGVDDGYIQASSDDAKKLYFAKQALEKKATAGTGSLRYYSFEDEGTTSDGRKLAPENVAIPIYEPDRQQ